MGHRHEHLPRPGRPARPARPVSRRTFLRDLGGGAVAVAVIAACGGDDDPTLAEPTGPDPTRATGPTAPTPAPDGSTSPDTASTESEGLRWERVNLGFVSAYVIARGNQAAVVDTGTRGSEAEILTGLRALGLGWPDVRHLVLTHHHGDHQGSAPAVLAEATNATAYAGRADVEQMSGFDATPLDDGSDVFGLQVIGTPGHTAGHISVYDPTTRFLVAGDALNGADGGTVAGPNRQFSSDINLALQQVAKLAALDVDTVVFGHGEPIEGGAQAKIAAIA